VTAARDQRRNAEAAATHDKLAAILLAKSKFPAKRFRVDKSKAGNSQLLNDSGAQSTQRQYGGSIVELISKAQWLTAKAKEYDYRPCKVPDCNAPQGQPCRDRAGVRHPHPSRLGKRERPAVELALTKGPCATCSAKAQEPCRSPTGRARKPHDDRPDLQPQHVSDANTGDAA
jgi:hypothetical protein